MILVDTSVWVDHFSAGDRELSGLLAGGLVLMHPFVLGELACGNLANRAEVLGLLSRLPAAPVATDAEVLDFIEDHRLMGRGLGYVDVHLLAAGMLAKPVRFWSRDRRLKAAAEEIGLPTFAGARG